MGLLQGRLAQLQGALEGEDDIVYIWPECARAWELYGQLQTQWRVGMEGRTGLDYAGVRAFFDECGIEPGPERRELFDCIRACESAALDTWAQIRERESAARGQQG